MSCAGELVLCNCFNVAMVHSPQRRHCKDDVVHHACRSFGRHACRSISHPQKLGKNIDIPLQITYGTRESMHRGSSPKIQNCEAFPRMAVVRRFCSHKHPPNPPPHSRHVSVAMPKYKSTMSADPVFLIRCFCPVATWTHVPGPTCRVTAHSGVVRAQHFTGSGLGPPTTKYNHPTRVLVL